MTRVFVYGTLKRGGANHGLLRGQRFLGEARTAAGLTLYSLGEYPGMVPDAGDGDGVIGELWEVDDACLYGLDALEGVDEGLYARVAIPLAAPADAGEVQAYLYRPGIAGRPRLGSTWPG